MKVKEWGTSAEGMAGGLGTGMTGAEGMAEGQDAGGRPTVSVVVPTYRRIADLKHCLEGLHRQRQAPLEVIVVCRNTDTESRTVVYDWLSSPAFFRKRTVTVAEPGVLVAMKAGTEAADGDVVAYTDDDAVPRPDWIEGLTRLFTDSTVGGAGGRDAQIGQPQASGDVRVGIVTPYGKLVGNHHVGAGPVREVDVLKGVNMALRKELAVFPQGLLGGGAQAHFEVHLSLRARKLGYKLVYDSELVVDHYPAVRFDADQRNRVVPEAVANAAYNLQLGILRWSRLSRAVARIGYAALIGDRAFPGFMRTLIGFARGERDVLQSFAPAQAGQWRAVKTWIRERGNDVEDGKARNMR